MDSFSGNEKVSVALCTYNGAPFLLEQLHSIAGQTLKAAEIIVCDDASSDNTAEMIKHFAASCAIPVRLFENASNIGVMANYSKAVELCRGSYIALCDQDDVWIPGKLEQSVEAMAGAVGKHGKDMPLLVHTDLTLVNERGEVIASSFLKYQRLVHLEEDPLKRLITQNYVTGSTILINRPLAREALPVPKGAIMHDWWLALVAAAVGKIMFVPRPTVLYRQHGGNQMGAKGYYSTENLKRLGRLEALEERIARTISQGLALEERLRERANDGGPEYLYKYLSAASENGKKAFLVARRSGIGQAGFIRNIIFLFLLAKGGYLKLL